jgi:hypothetical protein
VRKKIENKLEITCDDIDLTTLKDIEFYVRQHKFFGCYEPSIVSSSEMLVIIPFEDAKKLQCGEVKLQFAFTDEHGNPNASEIVVMEVSDLLKEVGYDPI